MFIRGEHQKQQSMNTFMLVLYACSYKNKLITLKLCDSHTFVFPYTVWSVPLPPPPSPSPLTVTKTVREFLNFASKSVTAFKIYQTIGSFFKSNLAFYYTIKKIESVSSLAISASNKYYAFTNYSIHCQLCPSLMFKVNGRKIKKIASCYLKI